MKLGYDDWEDILFRLLRTQSSSNDSKFIYTNFPIHHALAYYLLTTNLGGDLAEHYEFSTNEEIDNELSIVFDMVCENEPNNGTAMKIKHLLQKALNEIISIRCGITSQYCVEPYVDLVSSIVRNYLKREVKVGNLLGVSSSMVDIDWL